MLDIKNIRGYYQFLSKYLIQYRYSLIIGSLMLIISSIMILPAPLITKRILDHSLPKKDVTELIVLVVITLLLLVVIRLVSYATRMLFLKVNTKAIVDIRKDTLKKLFKLPYNQYHQYNTGYYISRINDDSERIQVLFTDTLTSILQDILTFIVGACAIVCINWKLAIAVMITLPFYGYLMLYFTSKARALSKTYYQNRSQVNSELSEALDTYDLSKVFSNLWYSIRRYYGVAVCEYRAYVKLNRVMMANDTTINVLAGLSPLIIVGYGGYEVIQGRMTIGSLIAFKTFSNYLFGPTNRLLNINLHLQKALISLDRIISIFKAFEETPDPNFQMPNHINCLKISNVRFSFPADESTIFEFNLSVRKGECIGIVGKSGSGKTTLIRIILGLYPVYEGQIILDGYSLSPSQVLSLRNRISLVEQEPQLFNDTVYQNIRFANHLANGHYAEDQHFPLNLRSYVSIVGESEEGVIFGGPDIFFMGWDSEKEVTIKNITFTATTNQEFYQRILIDCITRNRIDGIPDKFSLTLENLSFRGIRPVHYDNLLKLAELIYPEKLILRNITVDDCVVSAGFHIWGGNVFADNVRINNLRAAPHGDIVGNVLIIYTANPLYTGGDSVFHNLQITDCVSRSEDGSPSSLVTINHSFLPTQFRNYFINCTIADNHWSTGYGAAINIGEDAKVSFINSIISNEAGMNFMLSNEDLPSNLQFLNCLVGPSDNPEDTILNLGQNNTIEWYGTNISSDPEFHAWSDDNPYALGQESPCIDAGTTDFSIFDIPDWYSFPLYDLAGNPRIYGDQVDLGAYEWQGQTGIEDLIAVPAFSMSNYPNPFNPSTTIRYSVPKDGNVKLCIYNTKGQLLTTLVNEHKNYGVHNIIWNGNDNNGNKVSSGLYFTRIVAEGKTLAIKMLMLK